MASSKQYLHVRITFISLLSKFPIGMGTGAVYVTMSGIKSHSQALTTIETVFFFINIALFLLNSTTLLIQAICW